MAMDGRDTSSPSIRAGARYDALVTGQGESENANWDAVWQAATARTSSGWSAEILIPVKSLMFREGLSEWGFNVQRRIQRLQETDRWAGAVQDVQVTRVGRAGLLTDLPPFDLGFGLTVRPSLTTGAEIPAPQLGWRGRERTSLDATQRLGANTLGSLTVNTDFAETEVDSRRVNLTRFSLWGRGCASTCRQIYKPRASCSTTARAAPRERTRGCGGPFVRRASCSWSTTTICARRTLSPVFGTGSSTRINCW